LTERRAFIQSFVKEVRVIRREAVKREIGSPKSYQHVPKHIIASWP